MCCDAGYRAHGRVIMTPVDIMIQQDKKKAQRFTIAHSISQHNSTQAIWYQFNERRNPITHLNHSTPIPKSERWSPTTTTIPILTTLSRMKASESANPPPRKNSSANSTFPRFSSQRPSLKALRTRSYEGPYFWYSSRPQNTAIAEHNIMRYPGGLPPSP